MIFENYQIIKEGESARFAVVDIDEFNMVKELFSDTQKLEDYLDYLHLQKIKKQSAKRYTLDKVC